MSVVSKETAQQVFNDGSKNFIGFTLISPVGGTEIELVNMKGVSIHTWKLPSRLGTHPVLLPNGNLLCSICQPDVPLGDLEGSFGKLIELDWESNILWQYEDPYMHHDFFRTPNGNTIVVRWVQTPSDVAVNVKGGIPGTEKEGIMWSDSLREVNGAGDTAWEWQAYDHLDPDTDIICPLCFRNEWTHANAIDVNPQGKILISFMKTNSIAIIDKNTGTLDWRWGGFLKLAHPHDVTWVDNMDVLVLGCGGHIAGTEVGDSEILRIDTINNNIVWEYKEANSTDFYAPCKGGFNVLPNGNLLVSEGDKGRLFEVSESKEIIWEFRNSTYSYSIIYGTNNMLFRSYRYGPDYDGLKGNHDLMLEQVQQGPTKQSDKKEPSEEEKIIQSRLANLGY